MPMSTSCVRPRALLFGRPARMLFGTSQKVYFRWPSLVIFQPHIEDTQTLLGSLLTVSGEGQHSLTDTLKQTRDVKVANV